LVEFVGYYQLLLVVGFDYHLIEVDFVVDYCYHLFEVDFVVDLLIEFD